MADLYGELNNKIEEATYRGIASDSASVTVDNTKYTIQVDVDFTNDKFNESIDNRIAVLDHKDKQEEGKVVVAVSQSGGKVSVEKDFIREDQVYNSAHTKTLVQDLAAKQDNLAFSDGHEYDKNTNKVVTDKAMRSYVESLTESGMHFRGGEFNSFEELMQYLENKPTHGDAAIVQKVLYVYDSGTGLWYEPVDIASFIKHGTIDNSDIIENANISQSKVENLVDDLSEINTEVTNVNNRIDEDVLPIIPRLSFDLSNHELDITFA